MEEKPSPSVAKPRTGIRMIRMEPRPDKRKGKARLNAYDKLQNEESKEKAVTGIVHPTWPRLGGDVVIDIQGVSKAFGNRVLIENFQPISQRMLW